MSIYKPTSRFVINLSHTNQPDNDGRTTPHVLPPVELNARIFESMELTGSPGSVDLRQNVKMSDMFLNPMTYLHMTVGDIRHLSPTTDRPDLQLDLSWEVTSVTFGISFYNVDRCNNKILF